MHWVFDDVKLLQRRELLTMPYQALSFLWEDGEELPHGVENDLFHRWPAACRPHIPPPANLTHLLPLQEQLCAGDELLVGGPHDELHEHSAQRIHGEDACETFVRSRHDSLHRSRR